ncbi:MAG: GTP-binding protein [Clostridia bacterium]|nr:GTP-binding protein [Clostridia bacterium]
MTKICVVSGFLGAGKTTLIRKLISESYQGEKLVLIENEFGEIGIDGGFLKEAGVEITEMNSGCICCSLVGDFEEALKKVIADYAPDRIIIEPSGVGKLSDVVKAISGVLSEDVVLDAKVAVADAKKAKMYFKNFGEFYKDQIAHADCVVLSHVEALSEEKIKACVELLKTVNEEAVYITTPVDELSGKQIRDAFEHVSTLEKEMQALKEEGCPVCGHHHHHEHEHHHDHECGCEHHHEHEHHHDHECGCEHHEHEHHHDHECGCEHHEHEHHHDHECGCEHHEHEHHHDHECGCKHHEHEHHHDHGCGCEHHHEHEHHHDHECGCEHHHEHEHHHDHECGCGHHHEHGHHHADDVFTSWGAETPKKFTEEELLSCLAALSDEARFGTVLRAKGIVPGDGVWYHFDYVPGEPEVRTGGADVTGRLCVIGAGIREDALKDLFKI